VTLFTCSIVLSILLRCVFPAAELVARQLLPARFDVVLEGKAGPSISKFVEKLRPRAVAHILAPSLQLNSKGRV